MAYKPETLATMKFYFIFFPFMDVLRHYSQSNISQVYSLKDLKEIKELQKYFKLSLKKG